MDTSEEISATLDAEDIAKIDSIYIRNMSIKESNKILKDRILKGEKPTIEEQMMLTEGMKKGIQDGLSSNGNQRFFTPDEIPTKTWREVMIDIEWTLEVDVTQENTATSEELTTLTTMFQTIANPATAQVLQTPEGKLLFNKILQRTSVVSPLQMNNLPSVSPISVGGSSTGDLPANRTTQ
jgi:hypothetical protein